MSGHNPCTCKGTRKERMKNWYVPYGWRNTNRSYFERPKGAPHYSDYSSVRCSECNMFIRSKGIFVEGLPDGKPKHDIIKDCTCNIDALEPDEYCPIHGGCKH